MTHVLTSHVRLFVWLIVFAFLGTDSTAQIAEIPKKTEKIEPTSCAVIREQLDRSMIEFAKNGERFAQHRYLLIIVRPGRNEPLGTLNRKRMNALKYFFDFRKQSENVVFAEGENTAEPLGSGAVFINGVLTEKFYFKRGRWQLCDSVEESW